MFDIKIILDENRIEIADGSEVNFDNAYITINEKTYNLNEIIDMVVEIQAYLNRN